MHIIEYFHHSWFPLYSKLFESNLEMLFKDVLPNISYQPKKEYIFKIFSKSVEDIKVVMIGPGVYSAPSIATGRAFATKQTNIPTSLRNIKKQISQTKGIDTIENSTIKIDTPWESLIHWETQGVFLLNVALTTETGKVGSHLKYWFDFTKAVINFISTVNPCIWMFCSKNTQKFQIYIKNNPYLVKGYDEITIKEIPINKNWNYIIQAPHLTSETYSKSDTDFFNHNDFLKVSEILLKKEKLKIIW